MSLNSELDEELRKLERRWRAITETPETPRSLLNVVEYSLGSQRKAEVYVNRLLRYLLDPEEPHGMNAEFFRAFLDGLPDECEFGEDAHDVSDVTVDDQVRVRDWVDEERNEETEPVGEVDLVLEVPNEWFLLIELKFSAGENNLRGDGPSQTEIYYEASHVGERQKESYESGGYYLYLHPHDEPAANEDEFANWTWEAFVDDVLAVVLEEGAPRYPQRTVVQLRELRDDVNEVTGMNEQQANEREKIELYLDHYEAIEDVRDTFDERWDVFTEAWASRLGRALEAEDGIGSDRWTFDVTDADDPLADEYDPSVWTFVEARPGHPAEADEAVGWTFRAWDSDWGHVFKDGWWRSKDDFREAIVARDDDYEDVRVSFIHRLERNRDLAVGDRTLKFYFRNCGSNDKEFRERFNEAFDDRREEVERALPESAELTGKKRNRIEATYDIRTADHDDFFEAYVGALKRAFVDHAAVNDELTRLIDDAYDEALAVYE